MKNIDNFVKLDYETQRVFHFNGKRICGYLRDFKYNFKTNQIKGYCVIRKKYVVETLPQNIEMCEFYKRYFNLK